MAADGVRAAAESPFLDGTVPSASALLCCVALPPMAEVAPGAGPAAPYDAAAQLCTQGRVLCPPTEAVDGCVLRRMFRKAAQNAAHPGSRLGGRSLDCRAGARGRRATGCGAGLPRPAGCGAGGQRHAGSSHRRPLPRAGGVLLPPRRLRGRRRRPPAGGGRWTDRCLASHSPLLPVESAAAGLHANHVAARGPRILLSAFFLCSGLQ